MPSENEPQEGKKRRGRRGEGSIHWDKDKKCYVGSISLGFDARGKRRRPKVYGATKTEVRNELRKLRNELDAGVKSSARYTVADAVDDWLGTPKKGRSEDTVNQYRQQFKVHIKDTIGRLKLRDLEPEDVEEWLDDRSDVLATSVLRRLLWILRSAIQQAQKRGKVIRNVADLVEAPEGQPGRPSKSLTLVQARALLNSARGYALYPYIVVMLTTGIRNEEARALKWDLVDLEGDPVADPPIPPSISVWRSDRVGGDTKTRKSKRTLALGELAVEALRDRRQEQERQRVQAGENWHDAGLVFCTAMGKPYTRFTTNKMFLPILRKAGLENWTLRELRHSFISMMSADGVPIEEIARIAGHATTVTTETYYRRELRPVLTEGAQRMDAILTDEGVNGEGQAPS
ncbi:site-specific integrase [Nocardiopsis sp. FIRDI 009]|uniref:tyrosine-type recombinase/integrase n=1 Tax=Nocardiopsis sp. FIRDI 009 TaxID=714197 RepID=UPI000E285C44|nr:site-specific integrase [Nocardiopsis sp. FIRDI 009]